MYIQLHEHTNKKEHNLAQACQTVKVGQNHIYTVYTYGSGRPYKQCITAPRHDDNPSPLSPPHPTQPTTDLTLNIKSFDSKRINT
jgi:hypothetical protein